MARIRTLKPELLEDDKTAALPHEAWRLFVSLILLADDYGNTRGNPAWVAGQVFWCAEADVRGAIEELCRVGLVRRYEVNGQPYLSITNWTKHQRIDNAGKERCPPPPTEDVRGESPRVSASLRGSPLDPDPDKDPDPDNDRTHESPPRESAGAESPEPPRGESASYSSGISSVEGLATFARTHALAEKLVSSERKAAAALIRDGPIPAAELEYALAETRREHRSRPVAFLLGVVRNRRAEGRSKKTREEDELKRFLAETGQQPEVRSAAAG